MTDVSTVFVPDSDPAIALAVPVGDWAIAPPDLRHDNDLQTGVLISLFTHALADEDDVIPDGTDNRRGWWGDTGPEPQTHIGSKLWLLSRAKATNDTRLAAEGYARDALQWTLDDGVTDRLDVAAAYTAFQFLEIDIALWRDGNLILTRKYGPFWVDQVTG